MFFNIELMFYKGNEKFSIVKKIRDFTIEKDIYLYVVQTNMN